MKEITRIHLATIPYNIEVDAQKDLTRYLTAIEKSLKADDDTLREIESRISEILTERNVTGEKTITTSDVAHIQKQLGKPADFEDTQADDLIDPPTKKRVMADPANAMIGGVCAGLAAYWKIDVVWVRLAIVILTFATSGATIPIYLVAWLVMPPARTAAERLQMSGRQVTLNAIKDESHEMNDIKPPKRILLDIIRILTGIGLIIIATATLVGLAIATWTTYRVVFASQIWELVVTAFAVGIAGVLFATLCLLLAYSLFTQKFTRRTGYATGAIIALGLIAASIGALGIYPGTQRLHDNREAALAKRPLDTSALAGITKLRIDSPHRVRLNYTVSTTPTASVRYDTLSSRQAPDVNFQKNGGELVISAKRYGKPCTDMEVYCDNYVELSLAGPALTDIESTTMSDFTYITSDRQASLNLIGQSRSTLAIQSERPIDQLTANLTGGSTLDASSASIQRAKISVQSTNDTVNLAHLDSLDLVIPNSCPRDQSPGGIEIEGVNTMTVNGESYTPDRQFGCAEINIESDTSD